MFLGILGYKLLTKSSVILTVGANHMQYGFLSLGEVSSTILELVCRWLCASEDVLLNYANFFLHLLEVVRRFCNSASHKAKKLHQVFLEDQQDTCRNPSITSRSLWKQCHVPNQKVFPKQAFQELTNARLRQ